MSYSFFEIIFNMMDSYYDKYWREKGKKNKHSDFGYKWPAIRKLVPTNFKGSILDIGCGTGKVLSEIAELNPQAKITGIDVSKYAIKVASKKLPNSNFHLIKDGEKLPIKNNSIDFVVCLDVIEHIYDVQSIFKEFKRILKPGGNILITTPYHGLIKNIVIILTCFDIVFNPFGEHIRFFTKKTFLKAIEQINFEVTKIGYFGRFYPIWNGMYLVATKKK